MMNIKKLGEKVAGKGSHRLMVIGALASLVALYAVYKNKQAAAAGTVGSTGLDSGMGQGGSATPTTDPFAALTAAIAQLTGQIQSSGSGGVGGSSDKTNLALNYALDTSSTFKTSGSTQGGGGSSGFSLGFKGASLGFGSSSGIKKKTAEIDFANSDVFTNNSTFENVSANQVGQVLDFFKTIGGTYGQRQANMAANKTFANQQDSVVQSIVGTVKVKGQNVQQVNNSTQVTNTLHTATL